MGTLRCLISNIPQKLLSDIVLDTAQQQLDIEVVGDVSTEDDLPALIKKESVDLLLIGMDRDTLSRICSEMLESHPDLLIVGLVDDGRSAAIFVNDVGAGELADLISAVGARRHSR